MRVVGSTLRLDSLDGIVQNQHGRQPGVSLPENPSLDPVGQGMLVLVLDEGRGWDIENIIEFFESESAGANVSSARCVMGWTRELTLLSREL